jgi:hypothetical protein
MNDFTGDLEQLTALSRLTTLDLEDTRIAIGPIHNPKRGTKKVPLTGAVTPTITSPHDSSTSSLGRLRLLIAIHPSLFALGLPINLYHLLQPRYGASCTMHVGRAQCEPLPTLPHNQCKSMHS